MSPLLFYSHDGACSHSAKIMRRYKHHYAVCHDKVLEALKGSNASGRSDGDPEDFQYRNVTMVLHARQPLSTSQTRAMEQVGYQSGSGAYCNCAGYSKHGDLLGFVIEGYHLFGLTELSPSISLPTPPR